MQCQRSQFDGFEALGNVENIQKLSLSVACSAKGPILRVSKGMNKEASGSFETLRKLRFGVARSVPLPVPTRLCCAMKEQTTSTPKVVPCTTVAVARPGSADLS